MTIHLLFIYLYGLQHEQMIFKIAINELMQINVFSFSFFKCEKLLEVLQDVWKRKFVFYFLVLALG